MSISPDEYESVISSSLASSVLTSESSALAVSPGRISAARGNLGPTVLVPVRETIAVLLDLGG